MQNEHLLEINNLSISFMSNNKSKEVVHNISYKLRVHGGSISTNNKKEQIQLYKSIFISNNKKYYKASLLNRVYFRIIDVVFFIKEKLR